jgi:hypothetical protein
VGVALRCAYFALPDGTSIWHFQIFASHHARMGARSPRSKGRRGGLDIVPSALPLGYHLASVCGARFVL